MTGGRLDGVADAVRQRGTTITVRALFFNTPARRKFLRSVPSETRAATEAMSTLALAHPAVGFELVIDGDTRLQVPPGQDESARLAGVWGPISPAPWFRCTTPRVRSRSRGLPSDPATRRPPGGEPSSSSTGVPFAIPS